MAGRVCTCHIRSRSDDCDCDSRRKALSDRSFARRHTCGDIRSFSAREYQGPCAFRRPTLLRTVSESISRRSGNIGSAGDFRALNAGLVMSPAGFFAVLAMPIIGFMLGRKTDARWLIGAGLLLMAISNY